MSIKAIFTVISISVIMMGLLSCADVPSTAPKFPDFRTQTRFIHAYSAMPTVEILLEPTSGAGLSSFASLDFQNDTGYRDVAAGNRLVKLQSDPDTTALGLESDGKLTILILPKAQQTDSRFKVFKERRTFDPLPTNVGQVRFLSAALDTVNFDVVNTSDMTVVVSNLSFTKSSGYLDFQESNFTFGVVVSGTNNVLNTAQISLSKGQRFTAVIFGNQANLAFKVFQDDPL